jgi:hypothetical protein
VEASETADPSPLLIRETASKPARPAIWFPLPGESGGYTWFWKGICLDGHDAGNSSIIVRHRKPRRRTQRGRIQREKPHAYCTILYRDIEWHTCATNCNVFGQRHASHVCSHQRFTSSTSSTNSSETHFSTSCIPRYFPKIE